MKILESPLESLLIKIKETLEISDVSNHEKLLALANLDLKMKQIIQQFEDARKEIKIHSDQLKARS